MISHKVDFDNFLDLISTRASCISVCRKDASDGLLAYSWVGVSCPDCLAAKVA